VLKAEKEVRRLASINLRVSSQSLVNPGKAREEKRGGGREGKYNSARGHKFSAGKGVDDSNGTDRKREALIGGVGINVTARKRTKQKR